MMMKKIEDHVKQTCEKKENLLSNHFYHEHLDVVSEYAKKLCIQLSGDQEIVQIASYLHDISAILDFKTLPTHHEDSANIAEELLVQNSYNSSKTAQVKQCILNHTTPISIDNASSVEEVCLSNADAISQIIRPTYWLYFAYNVLSLDYPKAKAWYINKINNNWEALIEPAKTLIEEKYIAVKRALDDSF